MEYTYGEGYYIEGANRYKGQIVVDEHRLYLRSKEADLATTYIPLEKIKRIKKTWQGIEIQVKLSAVNSFKVLIKGRREQLSKLVKHFVQKLNLRKRFLKNEWVGEVSWR
jgi:hypothetical protein